MRSRIEPMKKIARSLRQHRELILNYFRAKKTISRDCGRPEQQVQRRSHHEKIVRLRTFRVLELYLYHALGKLPEPESTHDFF
jgi:hypothetical protein